MTISSPDLPPPSWIKPIFIGALFAMFSFFTMQLLYPCCCTVVVVPAAVLPSLIAFRDDMRLTPGQGFTVSFIAVGIGAILVATPMALDLRKLDKDQLRTTLREQAAQSMGKSANQQDIDDAVEALVEIWPYVPLFGAVLLTVMGGLIGLATVALLRRRQSLPPPVPPPEDA